MISLKISLKNRLFKQRTSKSSSKVLLTGFQTAQVFKIKPIGLPKASHEPWFESSCGFWTPRGATMTLKKGCRADYPLIFADINSFFVRFYITFGVPLCCLELKFSYLRTCNSHSMVNSCWGESHVRSHLVHTQQLIVLRAAVDFFYQEVKAQNSSIKSASRSRYLRTRYNSQVQLIHNQGMAIIYILTLCNWRAHVKQ